MNRITRTLEITVLTGVLFLAIGSCAPTAPTVGPVVIPEIAGRSAGAPQRCVPTQQTTALRIADERTVLYGSGRTIWVNHPATQCPGMDRNQILIVEPSGSQYCRGDRVRLFDPLTRLPGPACILGDFIPYSR